MKSSELRRTHYSVNITPEKIGQEVVVAGWVEDIRPLGALVFLTIRDVTGVVQAVFPKGDTSKDVFTAASKVPRQSTVAIQGVVKEGKGRDFPVELKAQRIQVFSEAVHPLPLDPTGRVGASIDARLDARALDIRSPASMAIFKIRHAALQSTRMSLIDEGYLEVNTAKIIGQAAEGGANLFAFSYFGRQAYLAQSPQLYKEQLTMSLDRVFEVGAYFRAEKSHTRRHLNEFISVDIEAAFASKEDVMKTAEDMVVNAAKDVSKRCSAELKTLNHHLKAPEKPFPRISYREAVKELRREGLDIEEGDDLKDQHLRRLGKLHPGYFWIVGWPADLKPFYIARTPDGKSESFDLQFGYLELASGGKRVSDRRELEANLLKSGLSLESFASHLKAFYWGMPPHSGWGFGFDRFMMVLTGRKNIREVVLYPRDRFRVAP